MVNNDKCPNEIADKITNTYQSLIEKYMPLEKLSRKQKGFLEKPWITNEIKACIRKNDYLLNKSRRTRDPLHIEEHKVYRNLLATLKRRAYHEYYKEKIAKNGADKAKTWRFINEITKRKKKKGAAIKFLVDKEGNRIEKNIEIADCLNNHFSSVGKRMAEKLEGSIEEEIKNPLDFLAHINVRTPAFFTKTTDSEILDILKNLNPKKSTGFDGLRLNFQPHT